MPTGSAVIPKRKPKRPRVTMQARSAFAPPGERNENEQFKQRAMSAKHLLWEVILSVDGISVVVGNIVWVKWKEPNAEDYIGR